MNAIIKKILLTGLLLSNTSLVNAQTETSKNTENVGQTLEATEVTVRFMSKTPYAELRVCDGCPLRLLPFTSNAKIYLKGQLYSPKMLTEGQRVVGTVFILHKPVSSINEIVAL